MASHHNNNDKVFSADAVTELVAALQTGVSRVLLYGPPGVGKSTLVGDLAAALSAAGQTCRCISADPGTPAFGIPGVVTLGERTEEGWETISNESLCTLDAGRFRLPLISAVRRLASRAVGGVLLIDGPGVVRGITGRELLPALVAATDAKLVLALTAADRMPPLADELAALNMPVWRVMASSAAKRPGQRARARVRTRQWDDYLTDAGEYDLHIDRLRLIGTPPPVDESDIWVGRQLALLQGNRLQAMGEVLSMAGGVLKVRAPLAGADVDTVLVRDATRGAAGLLETAPPFAAEKLAFIPPPDVLPAGAETPGPRVVGRVGSVDVALLNGVFGDPLLHVRLRHQPRSLLFDLGDGSRLPAHLAHQVSDVFISHAHMDHLGGFLWLLRSRIGDFPPCRCYGPPGLAGHVRGLVEGFLWDRAGDRAPAFEVAELHGDELRRYLIQAGRPGCEALDTQAVVDGVLRQEAGFRIRAVTLDHHTPVLAFAYEPDREISVRKDRLEACGLRPGPWLTELKQRLLANEATTLVRLQDGSEKTVAELAGELLLVTPGKRLVYATDLADTPDNRSRLVELAHNAHTLFCESAFSEADASHAVANGHLTTRACGEIATAAGVARLVPFHFSRRYADDPQPLYDELMAACVSVVVPQARLGLSAGEAGSDDHFNLESVDA